MTGLLMEGTVLGSIMRSRNRIRERPRLKGFEMALSYKDLESFGQRHVEGMEDPLTSGLVLQSLWIFTGRTSKGLGRCWPGLLISSECRIIAERDVSDTTTLLPACPLIQTLKY